MRQFDADLYRQLVAYPQEVIPAFDMSVNEMFFERYPDTILEHQIQVLVNIHPCCLTSRYRDYEA